MAIVLVRARKPVYIEQSQNDPTLAAVDWQTEVMLGYLIRADYLRSTDLLAQRFRRARLFSLHRRQAGKADWHMR